MAVAFLSPSDLAMLSAGLGGTSQNGAIAVVEASSPGKTAALIGSGQAWVVSVLRKRYPRAIAAWESGTMSPHPLVQKWIAVIVTPDVYRERGASPGQDDQIARLDALADAAKAEVQRAADSVDGLYDLAEVAGDITTAISSPSPLGHSEASPYAWQEAQRAAARYERWWPR